MGEGEVGVDGEANRQVGVEPLELAEQVADGQVLGQGNLREQYGKSGAGWWWWFVRRSAGRDRRDR
ncbi:hypothetical protein TPA0905_36340 [Streptomyces olivaceus]|nr:hypothetical protein TPA0905_36340 [Streptomyces olivaceus]